MGSEYFYLFFAETSSRLFRAYLVRKIIVVPVPARTENGPNGLKLEKETTPGIVRWTRVEGTARRDAASGPVALVVVPPRVVLVGAEVALGGGAAVLAVRS